MQDFMNNALKALLSVAALAVIGIAILLWLEREAEKERKAEAVKAEAQAIEMQQKFECVQAVQDWYGGRASRVSNVYGDNARRYVNLCQERFGLAKP